MAGNTLKERYDAGFKIGTSSDSSRPISSSDLVLIQDSSEAVETEAVRVGTIADLLSDYAGGTSGVTRTVTFTTVSDGEVTLTFNNGLLTNFTSDTGTGTVDDPFLVGTAAQLNAVRNDLTAYYRQTADIALTDYQAGTGWDPIGKTSTDPFTGYYDGDGYKITGLVAAQTEPSVSVGLFGYTSAATIIDLTVESAAVSGAGSTGVLVGSATSTGTATTITNCHVSGTATSTAANIGGLVGTATSCTITECSANVSVTAAGAALYAAGFAGYVGGSTIARCKATGAVTGTSSATLCYGGGFAGYTTAGVVIDNCYAAGAVDVDKTANGGFIGSYFIGTIEDCYSVGAVSGAAANGGFIGKKVLVNSLHECFWDETTSGQSGGIATMEAANKLTGYVTADMYKEEIYNGWDFTTVWAIVEDTSYPTLQWEA